jgi:hypothetical protein
VAGGERRRLVEEEELGEAARLQLVDPPAAFELEPAGDPPFDLEPSDDVPAPVVQTPSVAVHEPARGIGDQLAERRDAVLQRHRRGSAGLALSCARVRP